MDSWNFANVKHSVTGSGANKAVRVELKVALPVWGRRKKIGGMEEVRAIDLTTFELGNIYKII